MGYASSAYSTGKERLRENITATYDMPDFWDEARIMKNL
jgi:hypothetical protein